ncbi:MAG: hypothetical protein GY835_07705 [bacterium]|nr:hypothetical protein [bacterium]
MTWNFRLLLITLTFAFLSGLCGCITDSTDDDTPPTLDHSATSREILTYNVAGFQTLLVNNTNGDVTITGVADLEEVNITIDKIVKAVSLDMAQAHVGDISITPTLIGDVIRVNSDHPTSTGSYHYEVNYTISVPRDWLIQVNNTNGSVDLQSFRNALEIDLANGTVVLQDIVANSDIDVANGSISGHLGIAAGGLADLDIVNGTINVLIPTNSSAEFSAAVGQGSVTVNDVTWTIPGETTQAYVNGTMGAGDGEFDFDVTNGTIVVGVF